MIRKGHIYMVTKLQKAEDAFNFVRNELREVGLLADGKYLDKIELSLSFLPSINGEMGYFFDEGVPLHYCILGYKPVVIYLPRNMPNNKHSLRDTIRHEYGHALFWIDPDFINSEWFSQAFGGCYSEILHLESNDYEDNFVSKYAMSAIKEDFCETLSLWLKCRRSVSQFKNRPGLYRKLKAVKDAVHSKSRQLNL